MNKTILIIFGIFITIALLFGFINYSSISLLTFRDGILEKQQQSLRLEQYDLLLFSRPSMPLMSGGTATKYYVKSGLTSDEVFESTKFSKALEYALTHGKVVILRPGNYSLDSNVIINNRSNLILDGQTSTLHLTNHTISFRSNHYANNTNNQIRNFIVRNGTFRLENSFRATFENMIFEDSESATEISNTNMWSEATKLENVYWGNCKTALTFKTPTGPATGSYENTALDRCYFNLTLDNSVGIMVENNAEVSNSQWTNLRIWLHGKTEETKTGLYLNGAMAETNLNGVIFESFDEGKNYGIYIGTNSTTGISVGEGTSFLGKFEARISNLNGQWIDGVVQFKESERQLNFSKSETIHRYPSTILSFNAFIKIENLSATEEVTVKIKLNFIDHTSQSITLPPFTDNTTKPYWLTNQDLYDLYPSQNVIWDIEVLAQTNLPNSQTKVTIGAYGTLR